jgi:hypothetical protein
MSGALIGKVFPDALSQTAYGVLRRWGHSHPGALETLNRRRRARPADLPPPRWPQPERILLDSVKGNVADDLVSRGIGSRLN